MIIENKFNFGDIVYLATDPDQKQRMVSSICLKPNFIEYLLECGDTAVWKQEFLISETKDVLKATTN